MESKFNEKAAGGYSHLAATQIADEYFRRHDFITGSEILELTPIRQINFFVIKHLFSRWQEEAGRLRSPYFDYNNYQVKEAMQHMMDTLSRHIRIDRHNFEPLLQEALKDTLFIIFSPYDFYRSELELHQGAWTISDLTAHFKYYKINKYLADELLAKAREEGKASISKGRVTEMLDEVVSDYSGQPEETGGYLEQLNRYAPIREDQLYEGGGVSADSSASAQESGETEPIKPESQETMDKIELEQQKIYQQYEREMTTLNDRLKESGEEYIRPPIHQGAKLESLKQSLTINQKFMFINSLFNGDDKGFNETLDLLDGFDNLNEAKQYLESNTAQEYHWDDGSEEVEEFYLMLQRKYA